MVGQFLQGRWPFCLVSASVVMYVSRSGPVSARSDPRTLSRLFEMVAVLCKASQGSVALAEALRRIANLLGTEVIAICRVDLSTPHRATKVFCHETHRAPAEDVGPFEVSFARGVCGSSFKTARAGSVWCGNLEDFEDNERLASIFRYRRLSESVVIPLQRQHGCGDFFEMHFSHPVSAALLANLEYMGPVLANCWRSRSLGLFADNVLATRRGPAPAPTAGAILSMENPNRLSRAEFRVCVLLSRGLNNQAVLSELSITMATLRTHLRNIYAKTDSASQPELIHKLLSSTARRASRRDDNADVA